MKDYPIERIIRDARITTIYEGTSQLQVVAAIKGVTTGVFLQQMKAYAATPVHTDMEYMKKTLADMTEEYVKAFELVHAVGDNEYLDFHARRLVEMAGHIIMGYLLLLDAQRDARFTNSADVYIKLGAAWNKDRYNYIAKSHIDDLGIYKMVQEEVIKQA